MGRRTGMIGVLMVWAAGFCTAAFGGGPAENRAVAVPEMVVTAGRAAEPSQEITASMTVIPPAAIAASTTRDLGGLLAEHGFAVRQYPGNLASVAIRGFRTETHGNDLGGHVLILLNGRRAGTGNAAKILTRNIERVEIIRGPASVQYGSAAMGGAVNVITRRGEGRPSLYAEGSFGSWDYREAGAGIFGQADRLDFAGSVFRETADDYETGAGKTYPNTGTGDRWSLSLNTGWALAPAHRLGVIYTGVWVDDQGSPDYFTRNDRDDYTEKSNRSVDVIYDGAAGDGRLSWQARYFQGEDEDRWIDPRASNPDLWDDGVADEMTTDHQGLQAQVSLPWGPSRITAGVDWVDYDLSATWTPEETTYANLAGFALARTRLCQERLILTAGGRLDTYRVRVETPAGRTEEASRCSPSLGAAWRMTETLTLRVHYAQAFVMPEADQLAADYRVYGTRYLGNPSLEPEKSRTYEGGLTYASGFAAGSLTYFHTDFADKIQQHALADGSQSWQNLGDAVIAGVEGEAAIDLGACWNWPVSFRPYAAFTHLTRHEDAGTGSDLNYIPAWTASAGISLADSARGFAGRLNVAHTGSQTVEDWQSSSSPPPEVTLEGYTVVDLFVSQRLLKTGARGELSVIGRVQNLLDETYAAVKGFPMPGRSVYAGLRYAY